MHGTASYDERPPMYDQTALPESRDLPFATELQRITVDHLRRMAKSCRDLGDPELMAKAWDEPETPEVRSAIDAAQLSD